MRLPHCGTEDWETKMGTSSENLRIISWLYDEGHFRLPAAIADLGCAQLGQPKDDIVRNFPAHFGRRDLDMVKLDAFDHYSFMGELYKMAGFEYVSFDVAEAPFVHKFDLNTDAVPEAFRSRFDLVLNFGTSEHVINQYNVLQTIHDLMKVNGLMYSMFLINGFGDHGLIRYSTKFVSGLAAANNYEILFRETHMRRYDQWRQEVGPGPEINEFVRDECEWVVLRKTHDAPFRAVFDT
jgi:hypothetical protein